MNRPMQRLAIRPKRIAPIIAYDLETTRIPEPDSFALFPATPEPRYLTAWSAQGLHTSVPIYDYASLAAHLRFRFFTPKTNGTRFVAWNANRFDLRIVMNALIDHAPDFTIRPFVARNAGLRGARIQHGKHSWLLLDGVAMTGLVKTSLKSYVETYAPDFPKLTGSIDWSREDFDASNPLHIVYAIRDAEALYHAITAHEQIAIEATGSPLRVTIGRLGIDFFASRMPNQKASWSLSTADERLVRRYAFRGGYVYTRGAFHGPVWSYDLNQAYAAAMRAIALPCGTVRYEKGPLVSSLPGIYVCVARRDSPTIPYLFKAYAPGEAGDGNAIFSSGERVRTVLTSEEVHCLTDCGWEISPEHGIVWDDSFHMASLVDELQALRFSDPAGPSGPIGLFAKMLGNNAYGKTVEVLAPFERALTRGTPPGKNWLLEFPEDESLHAFWVREVTNPTALERPYHRPQIGAFITAHVRCRVYRAAMSSEDSFLKADTDSVSFSRPNPFLECDPREYGKWKLEYDGAEHYIIAKKVYAVKIGTEVKVVCKGLSTKRLTWEHFERWFSSGEAPVQAQTQLQGWRKGLGIHAPMFARIERKGTNVN